MRFALLCLAAALLCAVPSVSAQQPAQLAVEEGKPYTHAQTGLILPLTLQGLPRSRSVEYAAGGWDVSIQYSPPDFGTVISVYIYQAGVQDVALLTAEARKPLEHRVDYYGTVKPVTAVASFAPPGDTVASGLRIAYDTNGEFKSTALAIAPLGPDWIVKFRLSSKTLSGVQLEGLLSKAIGGLNWPKAATPHPVAAEMVDCAKPFPAIQPAKAAKADVSSGLLGALMGMVPDTSFAKDASGKDIPIRYCRSSTANSPMGIYHPDNASDRYVISLGDSGRIIFVHPDSVAGLSDAIAAEKAGKKKKKVAGTPYTVRFVVPGTAFTYPGFQSMPTPAQALGAVQSGGAISSAQRGGNVVTVNSGKPK